MTPSTATPGLRSEQRGSVLRLTLDRPERRNAITLDMARAMRARMRDADIDPTVRAIVITGTDPHFCAGADLADAKTDVANLLAARESSAPIYDLVETLWCLRTPVVTAVNGGMYGLGVLVALLGDIVISVPDAPVAQMFGRLGLPSHAGEPFLLSRLFPFRRLMEFAFLGQQFTSDDLARWGAINAIVDRGDLDGEADRLAHTIASGPTLSFGETKRLYRQALEPDLRQRFDDDITSLALTKSTHDYQEGIDAFHERREPRFTGA